MRIQKKKYTTKINNIGLIFKQSLSTSIIVVNIQAPWEEYLRVFFSANNWEFSPPANSLVASSWKAKELLLIIIFADTLVNLPLLCSSQLHFHLKRKTHVMLFVLNGGDHSEESMVKWNGQSVKLFTQGVCSLLILHLLENSNCGVIAIFTILTLWGMKWIR